jgi:hypothetical protein
VGKLNSRTSLPRLQGALHLRKIGFPVAVLLWDYFSWGTLFREQAGSAFDAPDVLSPEGGQVMPQAPSSDWSKQWSKLIARAWADAAFKARLLADPVAVLQEHGLTVPPGVQVKVVENTDQVLYLMLPPAPSGELAEEDLEDIAAGFTGGAGNDTISRR